MSELQVTDAADAESVVGLQEAPAEDVTPVASSTPGSVLRSAREARGQSIADVVQVIRFSSRQIEALERDDYASLPGPTAVRGLVRNYAKFLKLDAAPLLAQLEPAVPVPEADVRPPANMGEAEQPAMLERVPRKLIAAVFAVLALALAADWFFNRPESGDAGRALSGAPAIPGKTALGSGAAPAVVPVLAPAPAVVAANDSPGAAAVADLPPPGALRVEFDDRSWIEIRDATAKIVFVGEYPAGTRQNVDGKAPYQVWIGKASGVRLFLGERSIDLKPHTREEVARFTLE